MKELEDQEPHPMTATERRELKSIIKGEFVVLKSELQDHLKDLVRQSDKQIEEEFAALQKESTKVGTKIRAELVKTMTKVKAIEQEFMDKNLEPSERISSNYYDYSDIELTSASVGIKFKSRWQPKNLQKRKDSAKAEIQRAYDKGVIQLDRREVDLFAEAKSGRDPYRHSSRLFAVNPESLGAVVSGFIRSRRACLHPNHNGRSSVTHEYCVGYRARLRRQPLHKLEVFVCVPRAKRSFQPLH